MSQLSLEEEECRDPHSNQNQTPQGDTQPDEEPVIENNVNKGTGN